MGAAATKTGMEATWGRGCIEPPRDGEGPTYTSTADPKEAGRTMEAGAWALAQPVPLGERQQWRGSLVSI